VYGPGVKNEALAPSDTFARRHLGSNDAEVAEMLGALGLDSLDTLVDQTVPANIRYRGELALPPARAEHEVLTALRAPAQRNRVYRSFIGCGSSDTITSVFRP